MPVDPAFGAGPDKLTARAQLGLDPTLPLLLINFGGSGKRKPQAVTTALRQVSEPFQVAFLCRGDENLRQEVSRLTEGMPHAQVLDWVENLPEWMAASDLLVSRAGASTVVEAMNSGLPILVFDAPPGDERRAAELIEKTWQTGYWVKNPGDMGPRIGHLLSHPAELDRLRSNSRRRAHPNAARDAAEAVLRLTEARRPRHAAALLS
jgi:UDP-N-acetylglucosamine:LPS N-acetylglucosamine transferase